MENNQKSLRWPKDQLAVTCYGHQIMNYRYHWHPDEYEISILLNGHLEFCQGKETSMISVDDVVVVSPGIGHASFSLQDPSYTLVIHFSASSLRPYVKKGNYLHFSNCNSNETNRNSSRFKLLRYYAAQIYLLANDDSPYASAACKAALENLLAVLCLQCSPEEISGLPEADSQQELISTLTQYMESHYKEKLTLEDLAKASGYNRTYVSTLFKTILNVNFHDFLSRIRFRHALMDLADQEKTLTAVALDNGFSDLKTFNAKFKEFLHRSPAEYRAQLVPGQTRLLDDSLIYISTENSILKKKLEEYTNIF